MEHVLLAIVIAVVVAVAAFLFQRQRTLGLEQQALAQQLRAVQLSQRRLLQAQRDVPAEVCPAPSCSRDAPEALPSASPDTPGTPSAPPSATEPHVALKTQTARAPSAGESVSSHAEDKDEDEELVHIPSIEETEQVLRELEQLAMLGVDANRDVHAILLHTLQEPDEPESRFEELYDVSPAPDATTWPAEGLEEARESAQPPANATPPTSSAVETASVSTRSTGGSVDPDALPGESHGRAYGSTAEGAPATRTRKRRSV